MSDTAEKLAPQDLTLDEDASNSLPADLGFKDKSIMVLTNEFSSAVTSNLRTLLRKQGFSKIQGVGSVAELLRFLDFEDPPASWIITHLGADQDYNALQMLDMFIDTREYSRTLVSLIVEDEERFCLPKAYELGLFSHFEKTPETNELEKALSDVIAVHTAHEYIPSLTSAHYVRRLMIENGQNEKLIEFEESLATLYPQNGRQLMNLALANFLSQRIDLGANYLVRAKYLDSSLTEQCEALHERYVSAADDDSSMPRSDAQVLGLELCYVIDPDDAIQKLLWDTFMDMGVPRIELFEDGDTAWQALQKAKRKPTLIVMEWRIPKLSGESLIQRFRQKEYLDISLVLLSSLITKQDVPLLLEMGVNKVITKPIGQEELIRSIVTTVREERLPTEKRIVVRKIVSHLRQGEMIDARKLWDRFLDMPETTEAQRNYVEAEFSFHTGKFAEAESLAIKAAESMPEDILVVNLLGKCKLALGKHKEAIEFLSRASEFSPRNIERLCNLANAHVEDGNLAMAQESVEAAESVDHQNTLVVETGAKVAVMANDQSRAQELLSSLHEISGVVGFLNNKAVALAKAGDLKTAFDLYESAIRSLPEEGCEVEKDFINYNHGLALVKANRLVEGMAYIGNVGGANPKVARKAASLKKRLDHAIKTQSTIKLNFAASTESDFQEIDSAPKAKGDGILLPGERCCHLLYIDESSDPKVASLLADRPTHQKGKAITREASFGLERLEKNR